MLIIEFESGGNRFGVPISCVRRVELCARPAELPCSCEFVLGILNIAGETFAVIDFARRIGGLPTIMHPSQLLLLVDVGTLPAGLLVDRIFGVFERATSVVPVKVRGAQFIDAITHLDDGLCLILDPESFLFEEELAQLTVALTEVARDDS